MKFSATLTLFLGTSLLLAACSQMPTPTDPMQPFTTQTLNWQPCDLSILGTTGSFPEAISTLGDRARCADVQVPLDYAHPGNGTATMSMLRVSAAHSRERQGSIFLNPGGPGEDGLNLSVYLSTLLGAADPSTPRGQSYRQLGDQFDLIGFSPRGVGASTRLYCGTNELQAPVHYASADRSAQNVNAMLHNGQLTAQACAKNPITPFINTDATARDLDLTRTLLGEEKLNYVGYSYGTWLGAWYAKLFPEHAGRMLLDGNMEFSGLFGATGARQPEAFERDFRKIVLPYVARQDATYGLGRDPDAISAMYDQLSVPVRAQVASIVQQNLYQHSNMPEIAAALLAAKVTQQVLSAHPKDTPTSLQPALSLTPMAANQDLDAAAHLFGQQFLQNYEGMKNPVASPTEVIGGDAAFQAVSCNDSTWNRDVTAVVAEDNRLSQVAPLIGGNFAASPCLSWADPSVQKPATPAAMPPLLMLQNEYDPATPAAGALAAWKATPNSKMLFIQHESQHTAFPYNTDCVDLPINQYFLTGTLPNENYTSCEAVPLPSETQVYPAADTGVSPQGIATQGLQRSAFTPAGQNALNALREIISRNARVH